MVKILYDFQIYKGLTLETSEPFGKPMMACHEARLMVRDAQERSAPAAYFIYQRSKNRILQIFQAPEPMCFDLAA
jgi:hypothetical protein